MNATLYNGVSGILTHQTGLDSVSNNIANVNTTGYRANLPEFESLFAKSMSYINSSSPISNDFGHGVTKASNAISTKSGSYKNSEGEFDIAYSGKGWFVVGTQKNGEFDVQAPKFGQVQKNYFTRDGGFTRDAEGYLVNSSGHYLYGIDLGKISKTGTFSAKHDYAADTKALSGSKLTPLRIPEDLNFQPTVTTKVGTAINLNKTSGGSGIDQVFKKPDGTFDLDALWAQDVNALMDDKLSPLEANNYKDITITSTLNNGAKISHTFTYGGDGENGFKTLGELKKLIKEKTGLTLDIGRDSMGKPHNCNLLLHNDTFYDMGIEITGRLAQKLGLGGATKDFDSGASMRYSADSSGYDVGTYVNADGVIYRRTNAAGNSDPHTDKTNWERVDSSKVETYNQTRSYESGTLVNVNGTLYRRVAATAGNSDPTTTATEWVNIGEATKGNVAMYQDGTSYARNEVVSFNGTLYRRSGAEGASSPATDFANWSILRNDSLMSEKLSVPSYTSGVEVFSADGTKYNLRTEYYLKDSGNAGVGERWEARTAIYDATGKTMVSDSKVIHEVTFNGGVASGSSVTIPFGNGSIDYNPIKSADGRMSTNYSYASSSVKESTQDGSQIGRLKDISVDSNGRIMLAFTNGRTEAMGRVGIAAFVNDQGLQKVGGNMFQMTSISYNGGEPTYPSGAPILAWDKSGDLKFGRVMDNMLETSNVDIGSALTELIILQRGYSFNAKAFTTGDELIKEAIGLKRS